MKQIFDCFLACRLRDAPVLTAAVSGIRRYFRVNNVYVGITMRHATHLQKLLGKKAIVIPEEEILPELRLTDLRRANLPHFPGVAGWYYQQFLKFAFAEKSSLPFCLIWDADTVPLREITFFDEKERVYLTDAEEYHPAYFATFENMFGYKAPSKRSFISQHIMIETKMLSEMLAEFRMRCASSNHWSYYIVNNLAKTSDGKNLFSEYETYANYMLAKHPERISFRSLRWKRIPNPYLWKIAPQKILQEIGAGLDFIGFESKRKSLHRVVYKIFENRGPDFLVNLAVNLCLRKSI